MTGYYAGIDPLDGGDMRVSIEPASVDSEDYKVIIRDSIVSVCGGEVAFGEAHVIYNEKFNLAVSMAIVQCPDGSEIPVNIEAVEETPGALRVNFEIPEGVKGPAPIPLTSVMVWKLN